MREGRGVDVVPWPEALCSRATCAHRTRSELSISAVHAEIRAICLIRAVSPCVSSRVSV